MEAIENMLTNGSCNFVFLGEAGSGKSEIAINFAEYLNRQGTKPVHFFDMDMTKPLFRSRDVCGQMERDGIVFHYQQQFMDAPTLVGGVRELLHRQDCYVVMDVGGDYIGARSIGGIMSGVRREDTVIYYVLNAFRPWSGDIDHIDETLGAILGVSHIGVEELHFISNPNLGSMTGVDEVAEGCRRMAALIHPYRPIDFTCVREDLQQDAEEKVGKELFPLHLYLTYPWIEQEVG